MSGPERLGPVAWAKKRALSTDLVRDVRMHRALAAGQPKWDDVLRGSSRYADALGASSTAKPRVLVATVGGGYLVGTRIESLLSVALTLRGAEVHLLLCDGMMPACAMCTSDAYPNEKKFAVTGPTNRYCGACFDPARQSYEALGATLHRYSDLISPEEKHEAHEVASIVPLADAGDLVVEGVRVGEHALAGALRFFGRASLRPDPESEQILRRYLEAALVTRRVTERLLSLVDFDVALFHHGIYVPQGVIGDVARRERVRVVNWDVAYRKGRFLFSHGDTYHHTLLSEPTSSWETMPWCPELDEQVMDYLQSRSSGANDWISFNRSPELAVRAIEAETGVDFSRPCIGMLTNVMWDAQLHFPANAFSSMLDWAEETIRYFSRRPELQLLIRVHPAEITGYIRSKQPFVAAITELFPELPPNVHLIHPESKISTYAAMEQCNAVLLYGTKMGVELAAVGIPIIVAGEAWVRNKGITMDAASRTAYLAMLDELPLADRLAPDIVERARRYAYHFFFRRMIPLEFAEGMLDKDPSSSWRLESLDQLEPGATRGLDVICDGILKGSDFIYPAEELSRSQPLG